MNVSNIITMNYKNFVPLAGYKNKPNPSGLRCLLRSCRTDQTQFKPIRQACVVCEGVAGLIKPNSNPVLPVPYQIGSCRNLVWEAQPVLSAACPKLSRMGRSSRMGQSRNENFFRRYISCSLGECVDFRSGR